MFTVISNNFGASESDIILMPKQTNDYAVLFGQINVTTTGEEYRRAPFLEVTVEEDFLIGKSREAAVYVIRGNAETHEITITEAFLKDKNTLRIRPFHGYDAAGSYVIFMMCLLTPANRKLTMTPGTRKLLNYTVTQGAVTGLELYAVLDTNYVELVFKAETLDFGEDAAPIKISIEGLGSMVRCNLPVCFSESSSSQTGSKFYSADIGDGVLTIEKGDITEASGASYKFFKVVIPTK